MENKKIIALVQARMGSKRCPGKSMEKIQNIPVIEIVLKRLKKSRRISKIILCTSNLNRDLVLKKYVKNLGFDVFTGNENNLVQRFLKAFKHSKNKNKFFLRVTADNVFIDNGEIDRIIRFGLKYYCDFASYKNSLFVHRNNDFAGEFIKFTALKKLARLTKKKYDLEHVSPFFLNNNDNIFNVKRIEVAKRLKTNIKFDLDYKKDLIFFKKIGKKISSNIINIKTEKIIKIGKKLIHEK